MRHRQVRLVATVFGMQSAIGVVKIGSLATVRQADTILTCPSCGTKTREKGDKEPSGSLVEHSQLYTCKCGFKASWWGALTRKVRATGQVVEKVRLLAEKEIPSAPLYKIPADRFRQRVSATLEENAVIPVDATSAKNLRKIIIATTVLGYVIVTHFNDTYEERAQGRGGKGGPQAPSLRNRPSLSPLKE